MRQECTAKYAIFHKFYACTFFTYLLQERYMESNIKEMHKVRASASTGTCTSLTWRTRDVSTFTQAIEDFIFT